MYHVSVMSLPVLLEELLALFDINEYLTSEGLS